MTPKQWSTAAIVAYEGHDRPALELALWHLVNGTDLQALTREELLARRNAIRLELIDVNDRLAAMDGPGRASEPLALLLHAQLPDLEPSDPEP